MDTGIARYTPGIKGEPVEKLGAGAEILVMDGSMIPNVKLRQFVVDTAESIKVKYHLASISRGGTDAGRIHLTRVGVPSIVIGIPVRYIHSHNAIMSRDDFDASVKLVAELVKRLDKKTVQSFTLA
jgi:endoglucanase